MSTKDWKNGELKSLLTEAWGFKMDLNKLNEDLADQHRTAGNTLDEEEGLEEIDSEEEYEKGAAAHTGAREATLDTLKSLPGGKQTVVGMPTKTTDVTSRGAISAAGTAGQTAREKATKGGIAGLATTPGGVAKRTTKKAVRAAGGSKSQARQAGKKAKQITKGVQKSGGEYDRGDYFEEQAPAGLKSRASSAFDDLDEMCGPEHDEAEVVIMGDEEGIVGDEAADPAERVAALMDELKDLLMQLAGGGEEIETTLNEKKWGKGKIKPQSRKHRDAIIDTDETMLDEPPGGVFADAGVICRDPDDPEVVLGRGPCNEAREVQLRKMVRKAIREAMK